MDDHKILTLLRSGKRDKAFVKLYKGYPQVSRMIIAKGGTKEEAQDVFQEALIIFYRRVCDPEFNLTATISTYLFSVCRFLWKDELLKKGKKRQIDLDFELGDDSKEQLEALRLKESKHHLVERVLESLGEKCLSILQLFYIKKISMKMIAQQLNFSSENVAKNQKYKCLERAKSKLRQEVKEINF